MKDRDQLRASLMSALSRQLRPLITRVRIPLACAAKGLDKSRVYRIIGENQEASLTALRELAALFDVAITVTAEGLVVVPRTGALAAE